MPALSLPGLASRLDCLALPSNRLLYQDVVRFEGLTEQNGRDHMKTWNSGLSQGAGLMLIASLAFIGYAVVFFFRNFAGGGFELGVTTLNGVTPDNLDALNPAIMHYIKHLHLAISGFIAATAIAVGALSCMAYVAASGGRGSPQWYRLLWGSRLRCRITGSATLSLTGSPTWARSTSRP